MAFTDPSNSGFADLSNNAFGGSSHFEALEHYDNAETGLSNLGSLHPFDGLPAGPPNCGSSTQHGVQGPLSALATDQTTMQSSLTNLHHRPNLNSDPVQHASTLSSLQHERPLHNSETSMIVRKRPVSPRPTKLQRLSAIQHQLAKKTGVPEISLGVICFDTESQPKRRRTSSQKRSKKDVKDSGGSCFLCLVFKKKVRHWKYGFSLSPPLADLSVSAPVSGPVIVAENTGRSVFTVQQVSCGPVTFIQS